MAGLMILLVALYASQKRCMSQGAGKRKAFILRRAQDKGV